MGASTDILRHFSRGFWGPWEKLVVSLCRCGCFLRREGRPLAGFAGLLGFLFRGGFLFQWIEHQAAQDFGIEVGALGWHPFVV